MASLLDKLIVFMLCITVYLTNNRDEYAVVIVLAAIIFAALESFMDSELYNFIVFCAAAGICFFVPHAAFFLPLFAYDLCSTKWQWFIPMAVIPVSQFLSGAKVLSFFLILSFLLLSCILKKRTVMSDKKQYQYNLLRDEITEKQIQLEESNRDLLEKQDYEVHLATLNERNRIASELHDSIGHVLTRSILQTGALMAICPDESTRQSLGALQHSLSVGMDEVRASIHDLHDDSVDLYDEVRARVNEFTFCPVTLRYSVENPPDKKIRYAFLSILKEGLANIARHSNATAAAVVVFEHPALYQLIIRDNGSQTASTSRIIESSEFTPCETVGMGLPGIQKRVEKLGGNVVFRKINGFEIFVSVPKEIL